MAKRHDEPTFNDDLPDEPRPLAYHVLNSLSLLSLGVGVVTGVVFILALVNQTIRAADRPIPIVILLISLPAAYVLRRAAERLIYG